MPELPEVETVRRGLLPVLEGRRIASAEVRRPDLRWPFPERMAERLAAARVETLGRRSKYLLAALDTGETLIIHLGMSGRLLIGVPAIENVLDAVAVTVEIGPGGQGLCRAERRRRGKGRRRRPVGRRRGWEGLDRRQGRSRQQQGKGEPDAEKSSPSPAMRRARGLVAGPRGAATAAGCCGFSTLPSGAVTVTARNTPALFGMSPLSAQRTDRKVFDLV